MNNSSFHLVQLQRILNPRSPWARVSLHWELLSINKLLYSPALVLYSLGFGREGVMVCEKLCKLPPCPAEPSPDGSEDGHAASQSWAIRDDGNASVITNLRRNQN